MKKITIKLIDKFFSNMVTRKSVINFFTELDRLKCEKIILDFTGIKFISRSCADEYINLKNKSSKIISEKNITSEVRDMIDMVASAKGIKQEISLEFAPTV